MNIQNSKLDFLEPWTNPSFSGDVKKEFDNLTSNDPWWTSRGMSAEALSQLGDEGIYALCCGMMWGEEVKNVCRKSLYGISSDKYAEPISKLAEEWAKIRDLPYYYRADIEELKEIAAWHQEKSDNDLSQLSAPTKTAKAD